MTINIPVRRQSKIFPDRYEYSVHHLFHSIVKTTNTTLHDVMTKMKNQDIIGNADMTYIPESCVADFFAICSSY